MNIHASFKKFSKANLRDPQLERLSVSAEEYVFNLGTGPAELTPLVKEGQSVSLCDLLAENRSSLIHTPVEGSIETAPGKLIVRSHKNESGMKEGAERYSEDDIYSDYPGFLRRIGLLGMGGSMFPSSIKLQASKQADCLIINGVECEPYVTVDKTVLLTQSDYIKAGVSASARAVGAKRIILAIKKNRSFHKSMSELYPDYEIVQVARRYPSGAEKLILKAVTGKLTVDGTFPFDLGFLVQNASSLRAIGRAIVDGVPVIERPLSVTTLTFQRNIIVPTGVAIGDLLKDLGVNFSESDTIISGGLMMGRVVSESDPVTQGTTSIFVVPTAKIDTRERGCIRCGACSEICPLSLHPIEIVHSINDDYYSTATKAQLRECFLCGACATACPARVPLVKHLKEGKLCLRKKS